MIDLHIHSTASDGTDTPQQILTKCARLKLSLCSITDHDTISGQQECVYYAKKLGVPYITGVEFSVRHDGEFHILGYGIDIENKELVEIFEELQQARIRRMQKIVALLNEQGKKVSYDEVKAVSKGKSIGRPHVAHVLVEKGYVGSFEEAFKVYLNETGSCFVPREKINQETAISLILRSGGLPVLAHPKFIKAENFNSLLDQVKEMGMWGIEAYYPAHSNSDVQRFLNIAIENDLYVTAGSDYHGSIKPRAALASEKRKSSYLSESLKILMKKTV